VSGQTRLRCPVGSLFLGCPPGDGCGSLPVCSPPGAVTRRGSRGDCPARSSNAHLAALPVRAQGAAMEQVIIGGRSPQAVGDHRSHRPRPATTRGGSLHYRRGWIRRHAQVRQGVAGSGLGDRGANGVGRPLAQRLLESGERVIDVPAKLAARARLFDTGQTARPTRTTRTRLPWSPHAPPPCVS
jgi:hypothetical protein